MWPFKSKPVIDTETVDWQLGCFEWLLKEFGADLPVTHRQLILPKPGFFPVEGEKGHALAVRLFETVKHHAGMADWPVTLIADPAVPQFDIGTYQPQPLKQAAGTFSIQPGQAVEISYQPRLIADPPQLIATFAHELAHYVLSTAVTAPPCDPDEMEFLTDLTAAYLGFGVFMANAVLNFTNVHDLGGGGTAWSYQRFGYLPENDLVHATAIFLKLSGENADEAVRHLKPGLGRTLRRCLKELDGRTDTLEALADSPPPSPAMQAAGSGAQTLGQPIFAGTPVAISATWQQPAPWTKPGSGEAAG